ncbi:hypothetical protein GJ496_000033 [Pomphorhynchus laevis]|nr:hypothetical protein GJ496_000033 [Pomphorhynchus laevis]
MRNLLGRLNRSKNSNNEDRTPDFSVPPIPLTEPSSTTNQQNYDAKHVMLLFVPVSLCMLIALLSSIYIPVFSDRSDGASLIYTPLVESGSVGNRVIISAVNSLIFIAFVIIATVVLILLYKYRCYKVIQIWLILTTTTLLFLFIYIYMYYLILAINLFTVDLITVSILIWNIGIAGMFAIHWKGPLRLRQAYLIIVSALLALIFYKLLPDWSGWFVLAIICVWDLVAVLSPCGPLKFLVKTAQKRNEPLFPSLIYSSGMMFMASKQAAEQIIHATNGEPNSDSDESSSSDSNDDPYHPGRNRALAIDEHERQTARDHDKGIKLGLGDFIFYSILICKTSQSDSLSIISTFLAILLGLCFTLMLLALLRKALPALPISITMGIIAFFSTKYLISPFADHLAKMQIFI